MAKDPIEQAVIDGACKALNKRAIALRKIARGLMTTETDKGGRAVQIAGPEGSMALASAALLEDVAAELEGGR